jgi:tape measure domain-containing protein
VATGSETLDIIIRSRGGRAAAADAMAVANAYRALGAESVTVQHGISDSNKEISRSGSLMAVTARTVAALTAGLGAMAAARAGINYNAEMQTNTVAFRHFLGSTQAANAELAQLVKLGMQMPQIGSAAFVAGGRRLLAFGADANKITPWLSGLGEAMSGLGLGAEGIDRATLAIGQMLSTGFIQGDEINQLVEAGINARKYLINAGVVPAAKAGQIGDLHIPSTQALDVIMQGIQDEFHGLAAESRSTWAYQVAQAKNYAVQAAAAFIKPFQDWLSSGVLDSVSERLRAIAGWLSSGGADKLWTGLALAVQAFGPAIALLTAYLAAYRTAVLAVTAAQWAWNLAMNANPVGLIITGIGLLIGVIILLVNHWG